MSAGKSEAVAWACQGDITFDKDEAAAWAEEDGDVTALVPESLLLDARAKFDASEAISAAHEANWLEACAQRIDAEHRAERAEALAGEYERDALMWRQFLPWISKASRMPFNLAMALKNYAAIDALAEGGRGNQADG